MKKHLLAWSLPAILVVWVVFFFPRNSVINSLKIETGLPVHPDLVTVLGGGITPGGDLGISTRERLDAVTEYVTKKKINCPILVQEYPAGRRKMTAYLVKNGVDGKKILSSGFQYRDERGGTENNIQELFHVLKEHREMNRIVVVTSPYHQRRVLLMLETTDQRHFFPEAHFYFLQIRDDGEILRCSRWRFWRLVVHEAVGIFFNN